MIPLPREPNRGMDVLAWAAEVNRTLRQLRPVAGPGIRVDETPTNCIIRADPGKGGGGGGQWTHPFQLYRSPYTGSGPPPSDQPRRFRIRPGVVWGFTTAWLPANLNAEFTAPPNADPEWVWLKIEITSVAHIAQISSVAYEHGPSVPASDPPDATTGYPPATVYIPIGYLHTNAAEITTLENLVRECIIGTVRTETTCTSQVTYFVWNQIPGTIS